MSKPSAWRNSSSAYSRAGSTWTRKLSRNCEVVKLPSPNFRNNRATVASKRAFRGASCSAFMACPLSPLQPSGRVEVTRGDHGVGRRHLARLELRSLVARPRGELAGVQRARLLDAVLDVDHRLEELFRPGRAS